VHQASLSLSCDILAAHLNMAISGKLHNVARAIVDEDADSVYLKDGIKLEKKDALSSEKGVVLGCGLRILKQASKSDLAASNGLESVAENKDSANRYLSPVSTKPSTYLSNFIIYIATIGDIVDGTDTTHDFNYFSLVYEWAKDVSFFTYPVTLLARQCTLEHFPFFHMLEWLSITNSYM
jgi:hypothetical protein